MSKPKINLETKPLDKVIEILTGFLLLFMWAWLLYHYSLLPEKIPTHFNLNGEADGFGKKSDLFILATSATIIYILLSTLKKFPHLLNYPVTVTEQNAPQLYHLSNQMLRFLKFLTILAMCIVEVFNINIAKNNAGNLPNGLIFGVISLIFICIAYFIMKMLMISKKNS
ncbi:MAG: DUF1648 domain-containing protein [Raineya sp.]|jgi:uncharacterized membrane protein|nr:DUF1648 domain-containing protein [Raineya sp.]